MGTREAAHGQQQAVAASGLVGARCCTQKQAVWRHAATMLFQAARQAAAACGELNKALPHMQPGTYLKQPDYIQQ